MAGTSPSDLRICAATESDVPLILSFIRKLAEYERLLHQVVTTEETLRDSLFGARRIAEVVLAYWGTTPAGFAVYFHNFSTFSGRAGIYLEDLFVEPEFRGRGIGKALLVYLARVAKERNYGRLNWSVLNWNQPAIDFYKSLGATPLDEWTVYRLSDAALERLADGAPIIRNE